MNDTIRRHWGRTFAVGPGYRIRLAAAAAPSGGKQGFTERAEADVGLSVFQREGRHLG